LILKPNSKSYKSWIPFTLQYITIRYLNPSPKFFEFRLGSFSIIKITFQINFYPTFSFRTEILFKWYLYIVIFLYLTCWEFIEFPYYQFVRTDRVWASVEQEYFVKAVTHKQISVIIKFKIKLIVDLFPRPIKFTHIYSGYIIRHFHSYKVPFSARYCFKTSILFINYQTPFKIWSQDVYASGLTQSINMPILKSYMLYISLAFSCEITDIIEGIVVSYLFIIFVPNVADLVDSYHAVFAELLPVYINFVYIIS